MINVSEEFRRLMRERTDFKAQAQITLADGRGLTVTEDVFASSGVTLTDGAGASGLPLGAAVCRTVQLELVNGDGWLDEYDFFGARIRLWLTFALSETVERVQLGTFTVTEPETWGETVTVTAADDMIRADRTYVPGPAGEATLGQLWRDVCSQCGIAFSGAAFANSDMTVTVPEEECTCRQMLGWIAMLAGGNARVDRQGTVRVLAYDGGRGADHTLTDWSTLSTDTDDVVITGVEMETDAGTVLEGEEGYVLTVENPLAEGREAEALRRLGDVMIGLRLRRFEGSHVGYPLAECMDTVRFRDRRGRWYSSVITDVTFTCGACTELSNSAEGVVRNGSRYVSAETRARQAAGKLFQRERTAREALAEQLQRQLAEASGFYTTDVEQEDGSIIRYTHDKPTLGASKNVIKVTGEAIGFSTDGGKSYPFGVSVDGKTIMDIVAANGIIADWITAGILQSQDGKTFFLDLIKGVLKMNATELTIAGKSVNDIADGAASDAAGDALLQANKHADAAARQAVDGQTAMDILNKLTDDGRRKGIFMKDDELYVSASAILTGVLDAAAVTIEGEYGSLIQGSGMAAGGETTSGVALCGPMGYIGEVASGNKIPVAPYLFLSNKGFRVQDTGTTGFYLSGGAMTLECAFRPYTGKAWKYLDWVTVQGTDGNTYQALCGFDSPR